MFLRNWIPGTHLSCVLYRFQPTPGGYPLRASSSATSFGGAMLR